jgi:signal transduction histidine kinase
MLNEPKFSYVNIEQEELNNELNTKGKYYANVVHWSFLFSLPLFWLLDFLFLPLLWTNFLLIRLIVAVFTYAVYIYGNKKLWPSYKTVFIFSTFNVFINSIICASVSVNHMLPYFLLTAVVTLLFNTTIFWKPFYSLIQCLMSYVVIALAFKLVNRYDGYDDLINNGGGVYFVLTIFSILIVNNRYLLLYKEVVRSIQIEQAQNRLVEQNEKIGEQWHQIEDVNRKLKNLSEHRYNTMNIMLHDFRNFTSSIQMSLDLLKNSSENLTSEQKEIVGYIGVGNDKIKYLSERLAGSSEKDTTAIDFNFTAIDLGPEVEAATINMSDAAQLKQIGLQLHLYPSELLVQLDKIFLDQILFRLLSNVTRYAQSGSIITIHTQKVGDNAVIEVINKGRLIGVKKLDELFNKLSSPSLSAESASQASLGFSVAKQLVEQMGGTLTYNSTEATGNYYRIDFKLSQLSQ